MQDYLIYLVCGLLGVITHSLCKALSLIMDAEKANIKFSFKDYLWRDWLGISLSVIMVLIWMLIFPEIVHVRPLLANFVRISFGAMGLFGSYIIQYIFSRGKTYIRGVIDKKTNLADSVYAGEEEIGGGGIKNPPPKP